MSPTALAKQSARPTPADAARGQWVLSLQALTAVGAVALAGCTGGGGEVHHRLYASDYKRVDGGTVYVVLRYGEQWKDAAHSQRIGLIKFETDPEPAVVQSRWIWGKPANEETYVCFDALENKVVKRTDYVHRVELPGDRAERPVLAFADAGGAIEVVTARGHVIVPARDGFRDVTLVAGVDGPRLELARDGRWTRVGLDGTAQSPRLSPDALVVTRRD